MELCSGHYEGCRGVAGGPGGVVFDRSCGDIGEFVPIERFDVAVVGGVFGTSPVWRNLLTNVVLEEQRSCYKMLDVNGQPAKMFCQKVNFKFYFCCKLL